MFAGIGLFGLACFGWFWFNNANPTQTQFASIKQKVDTRDFAGAIAQWTEHAQDQPLFWVEQYESQFNAVIEHGSKAEVDEVLTLFAPESESPGLVAAHRARSIQLSRKIRPGGDNQLGRLQWHLLNAGDSPDPELYLAHGRYAIAMGDELAAADHFRKAALLEPVHYLQVALIYKKTQNHSMWQLTLSEAARVLKDKLNSDPKNLSVHLALAEVLFQQKKFDECEEVLSHHEFASDPRMNHSRCEFYVRCFLELDGAADSETKRKHAMQAFELGPANIKAHAVLRQLYQAQTDEARKQELRHAIDSISKLENQASDSLRVGCNLVQSSFHLIDGDFELAANQVQNALSSSWADPRHLSLLPILVINHLPEIELEKVAALSQEAIKMEPGEPRHRLVAGLVLAKLQRYTAAVVELEKCMAQLPSTAQRGRLEIHNALAVCYRGLGNSDLATAHAKHLEDQSPKN